MADDQLVYFTRLVSRFDAAAQAYAFMGSQPPEDHKAIEEEYRNSRKLLISAYQRRGANS